MGRGRGRNRRTQRKHFKENRENVWKRSKSDPQSPSASADGVDSTNGEGSNKGGWQAFATGNAFFDEYYKGQGIVPPEEWDLFMELLRKPLPAAFRINSSGQFALDIRSQLENDFVNTLKSEFPGEEEAEAIRPLPWYAENLAWHANFSRNQLRKNQTLERFHEFLKLANEIGNITRQEAVSMVPPLFLDVHPEHFVLDMCAAPGSKTFQLLEIIHQSTEPGVLPSGVVVANDVDIQRSNLLIHQTKRMCTANLIVTNHEAQNFPGCNLRKRDLRTANARGPEASAMNQLLFDRVLCDVPCSGDGTLRKAPDMWRKWNTGMGNGVHNLQLLISMRGISLLKVGGRMVYSTCSMNPVENEAVVAEILRRCEGSVELIDASKELPHLVRRPGLKKWKVCDKGEWLVSYKDVKKLRRVAISPSMFPSGSSAFNNEDDADNHNPDVGDASPTNGNAKSETSIEVRTEDVLSSTNEEVSTHPLERCMRIVPHDMNTGAFFIAVFHKHAAMAGEGSVDASQPKEVAVPSENINGDTKQDFTMANTASFEAGNGESKQSTVLDDNTKEQLAESTLDVEKPVETALEDESSKISETSILDDNHESKTAVAGSEKSGTKRKLQSQGRWKGVDPVLFFKDEAVINLIRNFYGITDSFPLHGHLISRNIDNSHVKRIYYISKSVKDILDLNLLVGHQLKIASCGLKMFERQTSKEGHASPCLFRISSEGLPLILPYITKQILHASAVDFKHLLQYKTIKFGDFIDAEFGEKASQLSMGCCVVVLREDGQSSSDPVKVSSSTIAIGCWKGRTNIAVMVAANECQDLLQRFVARLEAKGISLPEKVISSGSGVNDKESTSNTKVIESNEAAQVDESNEAAQVDEMECAS